MASNRFVTQGYGVAVVPPIPPAPTPSPVGMVESRGSAGGYTVPPQWLDRFPEGETMDEAAVRFRKRRAAVFVAVAVVMLDDEDELL